jgi:hypothetical protein
LWQHAHPDEVLRIQAHDPGDQIIVDLRPFEAGGLGADVMRHGGGPGRENRHIRAALALQFQLRFLQAVADLVIADAQ